MTFTEKVGAIGGLILVAMALIAVTVLALERIIDGATAVAVILGVLGLGGGTAVAARAVSSGKSTHDETVAERL